LVLFHYFPKLNNLWLGHRFALIFESLSLGSRSKIALYEPDGIGHFRFDVARRIGMQVLLAPELLRSLLSSPVPVRRASAISLQPPPVQPSISD
jgi:hypothetical protein